MQPRDRYLIESSAIALPGCYDRSGSPLLFINFMDGSNKQPGLETANAPSYEELVSVISYLSQIPDDNICKLGFTVVIDGRKATVKHVRGALRACQQALYHRVRSVLVIQPEKFLEQQKLNFELIKETYQFKCTLISLHKLSRFVDVAQLPNALGGTFQYDPYSWTLLRQKFEDYVKRAKDWIENSRKRDSMTSSQCDEKAVEEDNSNLNELLKAGEDLLDELTQICGMRGAVKNVDWENAAQCVDVLIKQIKDIKEKPVGSMHREERNASLLEDHNEGVHNLVNWILGAGERWLLTLHEIGESYDDAKQLLKEHNELESKSIDVEEQSREIIEIGRELQHEFPRYAVTLQQSIDRVQQLVRIFCTRVIRQKEIVLRSVNFYRMLTDFSRKTNLLLESLCTNVKANDIASAEKERNEMEAKVDEMEKIYRCVVTSGISFIDELCIDESNSMGRSITRDYSAGIVQIREILEESRGRRRRCQNLAEVRRLKIHQLLQLYTCEEDGQQVVLWIKELYETLVRGYNEMPYDFEQLYLAQENRLKLEETARSTYEYGKQLCQVILVLRRSLRMEVQPGLKLNQRLESIWGKFCHALSEREAKLGIFSAFHSTIQKVNERLDELSLRLDGETLERCSKETSLTNEKLSVANDIHELKQVADILIQELNRKISREKCCIGRSSSEISWIRALNDIQRKFSEVKRKQSRLEIICEDDECRSLKGSTALNPQLMDDRCSANAQYDK
uniref:CRAL-TRIO domain-containing protein n=1 Tax=Elaeophora elaphi TaxID=1147741 RepID=A0A0R3RUR7_9BILA